MLFLLVLHTPVPPPPQGCPSLVEKTNQKDGIQESLSDRPDSSHCLKYACRLVVFALCFLLFVSRKKIYKPICFFNVPILGRTCFKQISDTNAKHASQRNHTAGVCACCAGMALSFPRAWGTRTQCHGLCWNSVIRYIPYLKAPGLWQLLQMPLARHCEHCGLNRLLHLKVSSSCDADKEEGASENIHRCAMGGLKHTQTRRQDAALGFQQNTFGL